MKLEMEAGETLTATGAPAGKTTHSCLQTCREHCSSKLWVRKIILAALAMLISSVAHSQTIQVLDYNFNSVASYGYVYIDENVGQFPMPTLYVSVPGSISCQTISLDLTLNWPDPYTDYPTSYDTGPYTMNGGDTWTLDDAGWGYAESNPDGGYGLISYQINDGTPQYFYFYIGGNNSSESLVDQFELNHGVPWFWGHILAVESSGQQYVSNYPNVGPTPDGIGIAQVDGTKHPEDLTDSLYWNYQWNVTAGIDVLNGVQSAAYTFWGSQMSQAGSTAPPTSQQGGTSLAYCRFAGSSWEDAEWMTAYNLNPA